MLCQTVASSRPDNRAQQYRQIGNAVPVTLALALAKAFGKTVIEQEREAGGELDDHDDRNQNDVDGSDASEEY